ncbi:haloacid dehalogenase-like hydrolase, putative [Babesia ovis]|uniref:Haloacid dehalogenase-like hydrolase, putative n=1 Tax=Babesia ovis TaxID=5869 RepID=A0A9W5WUM5_BABOV|nr:haloacid dehalogenase-like hydrolase, putative [Babesia ovis]
MAHPGGDNTSNDDWAPWTVYNRSNVYLCRHLSHLLYRLHTAPNQKLKFVLSTHIQAFGDIITASEVLPHRVIMALDPEYLALMLRSSIPIASCALLIIKTVLSNKNSARHISSLLPHLCNLVSFLIDMDSIDPTTKALLERSSCTQSHLRARLISDCLSIFITISNSLGSDVVANTILDTVDLTEEVDDLSKDMFDLCDTADTNTESSGDKCHLCDLLECREFKEVSMTIEQLERDLDVLARAHLDDYRSQQKEAAELREDTDCNIGSLVNKVGTSLLKALLSLKGDTSSGDLVSIYLGSLKCTMELIPASHRVQLLTECLDSGNIDVLIMLLDLCRTPKSPMIAEQTRISYTACGLLDQNLHRSSVAILASFLAEMVQKHGFAALGPDLDMSDGAKSLIKRLCSVVRRTEIEIHMGIYDVIRRGATVDGVSASFRLLESVLVCLGDQESLLPSCHDLFAAIHRTANTVFEYFDEIDNQTSSQYTGLTTCCCRFIGCWMTLEPLHLKSLYLRKLPKMLSLISTSDFMWLLPTFEYMDTVDLDSVPILEPCLLTISVISTYIGESHICPDGRRYHKALSMCYGILERLFLEGTTDGAHMFASVDPQKLGVTAKTWTQFDYYKIVDSSNVHFSPRVPLEICVPLPLEITTLDSTYTNAKQVLQFLQYHFATILSRSHPKLRSEQTGHSGPTDDLSLVQAAIEASLGSMSSLESDWSEALCELSLATASVSLCRIHQSVIRELMDPCIVFLIMESIAISFAYLKPAGYSVSDHTPTTLWYRISLCATVLIQRQPMFVNIFAYVCRKVTLKPIDMPKQQVEDLINDGWISADSASAADFVCTLASSIR